MRKEEEEEKSTRKKAGHEEETQEKVRRKRHPSNLTRGENRFWTRRGKKTSSFFSPSESSSSARRERSSRRKFLIRKVSLILSCFLLLPPIIRIKLERGKKRNAAHASVSDHQLLLFAFVNMYRTDFLFLLLCFLSSIHPIQLLTHSTRRWGRQFPRVQSLFCPRQRHGLAPGTMLHIIVIQRSNLLLSTSSFSSQIHIFINNLVLFFFPRRWEGQRARERERKKRGKRRDAPTSLADHHHHYGISTAETRIIFRRKRKTHMKTVHFFFKWSFLLRSLEGPSEKGKNLLLFASFSSLSPSQQDSSQTFIMRAIFVILLFSSYGFMMENVTLSLSFFLLLSARFISSLVFNHLLLFLNPSDKIKRRGTSERT